MSTDHQQYSTENQGNKIRESNARRDIETVRTYARVNRHDNRAHLRIELSPVTAKAAQGAARKPDGGTPGRTKTVPN
jgi:hypothetical protein